MEENEKNETKFKAIPVTGSSSYIKMKNHKKIKQVLEKQLYYHL